MIFAGASLKNLAALSREMRSLNHFLFDLLVKLLQTGAGEDQKIIPGKKQHRKKLHPMELV
uniref:Uncharacterized protein n=1 Tax=Utricularia reniformis TaxID=192314 RepID=A0A1Y0B4G4_9LAMI|nr:hypothetical protein AEK19_MT2162 [Utricularia reniformis]ART32311.1 hypothetical protein AEK19_MT2162 [Utricularia reniformis]